MADWRIEGDWFETCNCDYLCPCIITQMTARPTHEECLVAGVYSITKGHFDDIALDGLCFVSVIRTPGPMADGGWTTGVIIDERADADQRDALTQIATGKVGGPTARLVLLSSDFAGVEFDPIHFEKSGLTRTLTVPGRVDQAVEGALGRPDATEPLYLDNAPHPAGSRLAPAHATKSHLHAFGLDWDDDSGGNNGHFTEFSWSGSGEKENRREISI
jgi:hypothetical protein